MGTGTMPARMAPRKHRTKSSLFGRMSATRSPLRRPSAWSAPPKRALMRSIAVYENEASLWSSTGSMIRAPPLPPVVGGRTESPGLPKPGTPVSGMKRKPRVGSAFAASSMAWGIVRLMHGIVSQLLPELGVQTNARGATLTRPRQRAIIVAMPLIETEEAARRLARAIASDLSLYNEDKIVGGIQNDNLFDSLAEEIEEGRALYKRRVSPGALPPQLLRPRARRHPRQGQGPHQVEALVTPGAAPPASTDAVHLLVSDEAAGARLDRFAASALRVSRSEIQRWIGRGRVTVDGVLGEASTTLRRGERVVVRPEPPAATLAKPEAGVHFDVLHTDEDIVVVDKPPGLVVHPSRGHAGGTLVNGLLALGLFRREDFAVEADAPENARPGIVHRLDKGTSGVMVVARTRGGAREAQGAVPGAHHRPRVRGDRRRRRSVAHVLDAPRPASGAIASASRHACTGASGR